jgi:two-component system, NtrC family, response regulator HydG
VKKRILLVDDNAMFLDSARDVLEGEDYVVVAAESGEEALRQIRMRDFPVVLMDIKMAGINGVETFLEMKQVRPDIRVIICTAHLVEDLIQRAEKEGAFAILKKPVRTRLLLETIERAIESYS